RFYIVFRLRGVVISSEPLESPLTTVDLAVYLDSKPFYFLIRPQTELLDVLAKPLCIVHRLIREESPNLNTLHHQIEDRLGSCLLLFDTLVKSLLEDIHLIHVKRSLSEYGYLLRPQNTAISLALLLMIFHHSPGHQLLLLV